MSVGVRVDRDLLDATDSVAVTIATNLEVTVVTPGASPRVTHEVVVNSALIGTETDSGDRMVKLGTAVLRSDHSSTVVTEVVAICIHGDRNGAE